METHVVHVAVGKHDVCRTPMRRVFFSVRNTIALSCARAKVNNNFSIELF